FDGPSVCVVIEERLVYELLRFRRDELVGVEGLIPEVQVLDRGVERSRCVRERHIQVRRIDNAAGPPLVAGCPLLEYRVTVIVAAALHAQRIEDLLLKDLLITLAGDLFDDGPKEKITRIVVGELRTGLEQQVAARVLRDEVSHFVRVSTHVLKEARLVGVTRNT